MITSSDANLWVTEDLSHQLLGREVTQPSSGQRGTVGTVLTYASKISNRVVKRVAHMRPLDNSGREWTADPGTLQPLQPIASKLPADKG
ncbi:hypothetical protein [Streptomyces sp. SPB4]|uniref:hypothetical protein n=1 Tax=Streptomyces sp. SPB4 TaxID=2940553 RepID=UPI00247437A7|nr:hypothetical protein [Streptomyces sp. SPB4]MDH6538000.1 hypothetical protein [Streptomyces sp. SPB4]